MGRRAQYLTCSFCGKPKEAVRGLIAGPGVLICDQCITLCNEIIAANEHNTPAAPASQSDISASRRKMPWWPRILGWPHQTLLRQNMRPESGLVV